MERYSIWCSARLNLWPVVIQHILSDLLFFLPSIFIDKYANDTSLFGTGTQTLNGFK